MSSCILCMDFSHFIHMVFARRLADNSRNATTNNDNGHSLARDRHITDFARAGETLELLERTLERRRLVGDGPPFVRIGGTVRYPANELEKWIADHLRRSTSGPK